MFAVKRFFRGRFFVVLVLIVCFLLGFMLSVAVNGHTTPHEQMVNTIITPFRSGFTWCKNQVVDFFAAFSAYDDVVAENENLKQQLLDLQKQVDDLRYDKVQNEEYKKMLSIMETEYHFDLVVADVVSVPTDGWGSSFGINAGTSSGIQTGDVVVCSGGLVGKVVDAGLNWSTVSTFLDPRISVGAMILRTGDVGVTEGTLELKSRGLCTLRYLNKDSSVNREDRVYTSGLGGVYPKGLLLGTVTDLQYEDNGLSLSAVLTPAVDFVSLREVYVITNFSEDAP